MIYTWQVIAWVNPGDGYRDSVVYEGQSLVGMLQAYWKARREGSGCIRVVWRG